MGNPFSLQMELLQPPIKNLEPYLILEGDKKKNGGCSRWVYETQGMVGHARFVMHALKYSGWLAHSWQ